MHQGRSNIHRLPFLTSHREDYVKRAKDFHKKEDIIKGLHRKAASFVLRIAGSLSISLLMDLLLGAAARSGADSRHISRMKMSSPTA